MPMATRMNGVHLPRLSEQPAQQLAAGILEQELPCPCSSASARGFAAHAASSRSRNEYSCFNRSSTRGGSRSEAGASIRTGRLSVPDQASGQDEHLHPAAACRSDRYRRTALHLAGGAACLTAEALARGCWRSSRADSGFFITSFGARLARAPLRHRVADDSRSSARSGSRAGSREVRGSAPTRHRSGMRSSVITASKRFRRGAKGLERGAAVVGSCHL